MNLEAETFFILPKLHPPTRQSFLYTRYSSPWKEYINTRDLFEVIVTTSFWNLMPCARNQHRLKGRENKLHFFSVSTGWNMAIPLATFILYLQYLWPFDVVTNMLFMKLQLPERAEKKRTRNRAYTHKHPRIHIHTCYCYHTWYEFSREKKNRFSAESLQIHRKIFVSRLSRQLHPRQVRLKIMKDSK